MSIAAARSSFARRPGSAPSDRTMRSIRRGPPRAATFARGNCFTTRRRKASVTDGLLKELQEVEPLTLPARDVRAGKPMLGGLLRFDLTRAIARITTLAALDLAGLLLAIYTALVVK